MQTKSSLPTTTPLQQRSGLLSIIMLPSGVSERNIQHGIITTAYTIPVVVAFRTDTSNWTVVSGISFLYKLFVERSDTSVKAVASASSPQLMANYHFRINPPATSLDLVSQLFVTVLSCHMRISTTQMEGHGSWAYLSPSDVHVACPKPACEG